MANESGEWIMHGLDWEDPLRIRSWQELVGWIDEIGFLPLFKNEIEGFSAEEHVSPLFWWTGDPLQDPWEWREIIAKSGQAAYGKFFNKKAGFVSRECFPLLANYRRDGYDFDARWDDELASLRSKKLMDPFEIHEELPSYELKKIAGYGKDGEKNFDGEIANLQMQTYLVIRRFSRKKNKKGQEYGMAASVYCKPEQLWGREAVVSAYEEDPEVSLEKICARIREHFPHATKEQILRLIK